MSTYEETLRGLQEVRVSKDSLLEVIKDNRRQHAEQFDLAYAGWKVEVIEDLEKTLRKEKKDYRDMLKRYKKSIALWEERLARAKNDDFITDAKHFRVAKPTHHIEDYNGAIKKLELSLDDELELTSQDFNQFVMDQWAWKSAFDADYGSRAISYSNSIYNAPTGRGVMSGSVSSSNFFITTGSVAPTLLDGSYKTFGF